jgi:hypothetical protein
LPPLKVCKRSEKIIEETGSLLLQFP